MKRLTFYFITVVLFLFSIQKADAQCNCDVTIPLTTYSYDASGMPPGSVICIEGGTRDSLRIENAIGSSNNPIIITDDCSSTPVQFINNPESSPLFLKKVKNIHFEARKMGQITMNNSGFTLFDDNYYPYNSSSPTLSDTIVISKIDFDSTDVFAGFKSASLIDSVDFYDCSGSMRIAETTISNCNFAASLPPFNTISNHSIQIDGYYNYTSNLTLHKNHMLNATLLSDSQFDNVKITENDFNNSVISYSGETALIERNFASDSSIIYSGSFPYGDLTDSTWYFRHFYYEIHNNIFSESSLDLRLYTLDTLETHVTNNTFIESTFENIIYQESIINNYKINYFALQNNLFVNSGQEVSPQKYTPYFSIIGDQDDFYKDIDFKEKGNYYTQSVNGLHFKDPSNVNYRPTSGSPFVDYGVDVNLTEDFDFNPRKLGKKVDAGAFEWFPDSTQPNYESTKLRGIYVNKNPALWNSTENRYIDEVYDGAPLPDSNLMFRDIITWSMENNSAQLYEPFARPYLEKLSGLGFNYLICYGLNGLKSDYDFGQGVAVDTVVAQFIKMAKTEYGFIDVAATGEQSESFNKIVSYNNGRNWDTRIDVLHFEYEYWNTNNWSNYQGSSPKTYYDLRTQQMVTNTLPGSNPGSSGHPDFVDHFSYMIYELKETESLADSNDLLLEFYASRTEIEAYDDHIRPNNSTVPDEEIGLISNYADRLLLAHYSPSHPFDVEGIFRKPTSYGASSNYPYYGSTYGAADRYMKILTDHPNGENVMPIFHGDEDLSGIWLRSGMNPDDFYEAYSRGDDDDCGFNIQAGCPQYQPVDSNTLAGSTWFKDIHFFDGTFCVEPWLVHNTPYNVTVREGMSAHISSTIMGKLPVHAKVYDPNNNLVYNNPNHNDRTLEYYIHNFQNSDAGIYTLEIGSDISGDCQNNGSDDAEYFNLGYSANKKGNGSFSNETNNAENSADEKNNGGPTQNQLYSSEIKVYPNPSNGNIKVSAGSENIREIEVYSLVGNSVYRSKPNSSFVNLSLDLSPGVYHVKVTTGKNITSEHNLVIQ
ncbi:T9SS type A sorting domain-containing protein [Salibacter halophilus]|uniref:T9SS type A sorting domain-containing protein n=1 Tax=Salibacter halophilus TaxID=1803916 RepID=A0A6N6M2G0_9FLAO|nr:T9SS type A sorting domain-containing protein [Salibacter halophilus]KAB1063225.1 T9SS type A sorting domain-containing protein [Salibacter halophilus]